MPSGLVYLKSLNRSSSTKRVSGQFFDRSRRSLNIALEKCSISAERSLVSLNMTCSPSLVSLTMACGPHFKSSNIFISDAR